MRTLNLRTTSENGVSADGRKNFHKRRARYPDKKRIVTTIVSMERIPLQQSDHGVFDTLHGGMNSFHGGNRTFHGRNYRKRKVTTVVKINMSMDNNRSTMVFSKVSMEAVQVSIHRDHSSMSNDAITNSRSLFKFQPDATLVFVNIY